MMTGSGRSRWFILGILLVLSVAVFALHELGWLAPVEQAAAAPLASVQTWVATNMREFNNFITTVQMVGELRARVDELTTENDRLAVENVQLREELNRAAIYEKLLRYERENADFQYLPADVIGRDTDPNLLTLRLNKGLVDGVDNGMPIVTERGLVGRVIDVGPNWCQVQLLIDNGSAVRARLGQSRAEGVVAGRGDSPLLMDYITQEIEISAGEYVLTSGVGGRLPSGLVIGQVTSVRQSDEALFQQADVRPSVDFSRLEVVLIIVSFRPASGDAEAGGGHR